MKKFNLRFIIISILTLVASITVNSWQKSYQHTSNNASNITVEITDLTKGKSTEYIEVANVEVKSLPTSYSLTEDITIKIENQSPFGLCYSFGALNMVETHLALTQGVDYDFSEIHMATSKYVKNGNTETYSDTAGYENVVDFKHGGSIYDFLSYIYKHSGPVLEADMPYSDYSSQDDISKSEYLAQSKYTTTTFDTPVTIDQVVSFPDISKLSTETEKDAVRDLIKSHIKNYGGCMSDIESSAGFTTYNNYTFLNDDVSGVVDHMITIVGWDDTIDTPETNAGAWLCVNSWGEYSGDNGYFYVPYGTNLVEDGVYGVKSASLDQNVTSNVEALDGWSGTDLYYGSAQSLIFATSIDLSEYQNLEIEKINTSILGTSYSLKIAFFDHEPTINDMKTTYNSGTTLSFSSNVNEINSSNKELVATFDLIDTVEITNKYAVLVQEMSGITQLFAYLDNASDTASSSTLENSYIYYNSQFNAYLYETESVVPLFRCYISTNEEPTPQSYNINYSLGGGTNNSNNANSYLSTDEQIKLYIPTRDGYTFDGWYTDSGFTNKITTSSSDAYGEFYKYIISSYQDLTFYAKWTENVVTPSNYTISYVLNDGINNSNNINNYLSTDSQIKLYLPTKDGYTFDGWYTDSALTNKITNTSSDNIGTYYLYTISTYQDLTFYAKWTENVVAPSNFTISYVLNDGLNNSNNISNYLSTDSQIKLYLPTKDGYTFDGWYTDSTLTNKITNTSSDNIGTYYLYTISTYQNLTFYAKWTEIIDDSDPQSYTISYYNHDFGGGSNTNFMTSYDETINSITLHEPDHVDGLVFDGWYSDEAFLNPLTYQTSTNTYLYLITNYQNLTFYAKWSLEDITINNQPDNVSGQYTGNAYTVSLVASHPLSSDAYPLTYSWQYKASNSDEFATIGGNATRILRLTNASQSGFYRCVISLDYKGILTTITSNEAQVSISKISYDLSWDYDNTKTLRYNGEPYTIKLKNQDKYGSNLVITLQGNKATDKGNYTATAIITNNNPNYNDPVITPLSWEIKPAELEIMIRDAQVYSEEEFYNFSNFDYEIFGQIYDDYSINPIFKLNTISEYVKEIVLDSYTSNNNYKVTYTAGKLKYVRSEITKIVNEREFLIENIDGFVIDAEFLVSFNNEKNLPTKIQKEISDKKFIIYDYFSFEITDNNLTSPSTISFDINPNIKDKNIKILQVTENGLEEVSFALAKDKLSLTTSTYGQFLVVEAPEDTDIKSVVIALIIILIAGLFVCLAITGIRHKYKIKYSKDKNDTIIYH